MLRYIRKRERPSNVPIYIEVDQKKLIKNSEKENSHEYFLRWHLLRETYTIKVSGIYKVKPYLSIFDVQ